MLSGRSTLAQPITCDVYNKTGSNHFFQHEGALALFVLISGYIC